MDFANLQKDAVPKAVQTGYFGVADQVFPVADFIASSQKKDDIFYLLDPVLGDAGKLYVDQNIADAMQQKLLPLADMITPNAFELGLLVRQPINSLADAEEAGRKILGQMRRLRAVFATGIDASLPAGEGRIADILITRDASVPFVHKSKAHGISGSGDVLSAMILAGYLNCGDLTKACQSASNIVNQMIRKTATPLGLDVADLLWRLIPNQELE
jgi:pyridoxine kinase